MNWTRRSNQRGQAIVMAVVMVGVLATVTVWMFAQIKQVDSHLRYPRVKGRQTIQRAKIMSALTVPILYKDCVGVSAVQTCALDEPKLASLLEAPEGADCTGYVKKVGEIVPLNGRCGFSIRQINDATPLLNYNTREFSGMVHYMGTEISIADSVINFKIPGEVLTADIALCEPPPVNAPVTPLLTGFDPGTGNAICTGFTEPTSCGAGEFVKSIDPKTMQVTCHSYVSGITCNPTTDFIGNLAYSGGVYSGSCATRQNPWIYYDFNPENFLTVGPGVIVHPPGPAAWYNWGPAAVPQNGLDSCDAPPACTVQ